MIKAMFACDELEENGCMMQRLDFRQQVDRKCIGRPFQRDE